MDMGNLINFVSPSSAKEVKRWEDDVDPTDFTDAASIQAALDTRVIWRGSPVTGQQMLDAIPAYNLMVSDVQLAKDRDTRKAEIGLEADGLIDAQAGDTSRKRMMMIAGGIAMLDKQVGRGGSPARDPKQDVLAAIFDYVEQVNANEQAAFGAVDVATDPSTVTLEHPPLP